MPLLAESPSFSGSILSRVGNWPWERTARIPPSEGHDIHEQTVRLNDQDPRGMDKFNDSTYCATSKKRLGSEFPGMISPKRIKVDDGRTQPPPSVQKASGPFVLEDSDDSDTGEPAANDVPPVHAQIPYRPQHSTWFETPSAKMERKLRSELLRKEALARKQDHTGAAKSNPEPKHLSRVTNLDAFESGFKKLPLPRQNVMYRSAIPEPLTPSQVIDLTSDTDDEFDVRPDKHYLSTNRETSNQSWDLLEHRNTTELESRNNEATSRVAIGLRPATFEADASPSSLLGSSASQQDQAFRRQLELKKTFNNRTEQEKKMNAQQAAKYHEERKAREKKAREVEARKKENHLAGGSRTLNVSEGRLTAQPPAGSSTSSELFTDELAKQRPSTAKPAAQNPPAVENTGMASAGLQKQEHEQKQARDARIQRAKKLNLLNRQHDEDDDLPSVEEPAIPYPPYQPLSSIGKPSVGLAKGRETPKSNPDDIKSSITTAGPFSLSSPAGANAIARLNQEKNWRLPKRLQQSSLLHQTDRSLDQQVRAPLARSKTKMAPTRKDAGRRQPSPEPRPTTGGKTIDQAFFFKTLDDLYDGVQAEKEDSDNDSEFVDDDYCHFAYSVLLREIGAEDDQDQDPLWVAIGNPFETLGDANAAAVVASHRDRPGGLRFNDLELGTKNKMLEHGLLHRTIHQEGIGRREVKVVREVRTFDDGILPASKESWAPKTVYVILERETTTVQGDEMFEILRETSRERVVDYGPIGDLHHANYEAVLHFVEMTYESQEINLQIRDGDKRERVQWIWDSTVKAGQPVRLEKQRDGWKIEVWVQVGWWKGARN